MELVIDRRGDVKCVYGEAIDVARLGAASIQRASHVEPAAGGGWLADLAPVGGPVFGPFPRRLAALEAELAWLQAHWLLLN